MLKDKIIDEILKKEGGYVDDPSDSGGETNYGITIRVAEDYGYFGKMRDLPESTARKIYEDKYLKPIMFDELVELSEDIAYEVADTGVNMGVKTASKMLQRALNIFNNQENYYHDIVEDGIVGRATVRALWSFLSVRGEEGNKVMQKALNCLQGARYFDITRANRRNEKFIYGWIKNRVNL